jgi:hypothetical protein
MSCHLNTMRAELEWTGKYAGRKGKRGIPDAITVDEIGNAYVTRRSRWKALLRRL